jgi:hypothetical protein
MPECSMWHYGTDKEVAALGKGEDGFLAAGAVVGAEVAAFAVFDPFLADLVAADVKFPASANKWRHVTMPE